MNPPILCEILTRDGVTVFKFPLDYDEYGVLKFPADDLRPGFLVRLT